MKTTMRIEGAILTKLDKEYDGQKSSYVQFLSESDSRGVEILKVKLTVAEDMAKVQKDMVVSIPVSVVAVNGNIYFSQADAIRYPKEGR